MGPGLGVIQSDLLLVSHDVGKKECKENPMGVLCAEGDWEWAGTSCLFSAVSGTRLLSLLIVAAFFLLSVKPNCMPHADDLFVAHTGQNSAARKGRKKAKQCVGKMLHALYRSLHWLSCSASQLLFFVRTH